MLDEPDWSRAPVAKSFIQSEPREGEPASEDTEVRLLYDATYLDVGVFAHDREPQDVIISELTKDFNRQSGDAFEIVLDTFRDERNGYKQTYQIGGAVRLNDRFNASLNVSRNQISLPAGHYTTDLITGRLEYGFSTRAFLNALLQYNTDAREWSSNVRFNVIHRPLSDFFFVINERRDSDSGDLIDRALIAKMTHMVAL